MTPTRTTTPFGRETTAAEVAAGIELPGRRMIVTGGASGLGIETARALAGTGAEVTLAVRDLAAGERVAAELGARVSAAPLDLADPASIDAFVAAWSGPLHVLVDNAGVMAAPLTRTEQGWELQFATNHLGHFRLATGLFPALAAAEGARVVSVSSAAHLRSPVVFDDLMFDHRDYDPWLAYAQSKTANVLFAVEAAKRWGDDGIAVNSLHPGGIRTALQRYVSDEELARLRTPDAPAWKTPEQGAATSVLLAVSKLVGCVTGRYFEDCNEALPHEDGRYGGVAAYALDPENAARLWDVSEGLLA
jgi:NAD(P)-dependent dehydrogenase (short-subunit alcohol dehydrogenase family)